MFTSVQNTPTDTSRIMSDQISRHPLAHSSWYIKLNITVLNLINHLRYISAHWNPTLNWSFKNIPFYSPTLRNPYIVGLRCILEVFRAPLMTLKMQLRWPDKAEVTAPRTRVHVEEGTTSHSEEGNHPGKMSKPEGIQAPTQELCSGRCARAQSFCLFHSLILA